MKRIRKILGLCLVVSSLFLSPVIGSANTKTISNSDYSKWQYPYSGSFEAYKYTSSSKAWIHAQVNFKYNGTQISNMLKTSYYPTIEIKLDNPTPKAQGKTYSTTMPDPKIDTDSCYYSTFSAVCEIEVASKSPSRIVGGSLYNLSTEWDHSYPISADPYLIAWGSQSREPTAAECSVGQCELNTVSGTPIALAGFHASELSSSLASEIIQTNDESEITDDVVQQQIPTTAYSLLQSKGDLDKYADEKKKEVTTLKDNNKEEHFILTFNKPVSSEEIITYLEDIKPTNITGRSFDETGKRVTVGLLDFDPDTIRNVQNNTNNFQGFIEIEGTAKAEVLKKLLKNSDVYSIEVAGKTAPMGLYWKHENM